VLTTRCEIPPAKQASRACSTRVDRARSSTSVSRSVPPRSSRLRTSRPGDRGSDSSAMGPLPPSFSWKVDSFYPSSLTSVLTLLARRTRLGALEKSARGVLLPHQPRRRNTGVVWSAKTTRPRQPIRRGRSQNERGRKQFRSYAKAYRMARVFAAKPNSAEVASARCAHLEERHRPEWTRPWRLEPSSTRAVEE